MMMMMMMMMMMTTTTTTTTMTQDFKYVEYPHADIQEREMTNIKIVESCYLKGKGNFVLLT
jgi:hypothetical protein